MLISYHYFKQPIEPMMSKWFHGEWPEIFADSGAYSAKSQGAEIDLDVYAEWLKANKHLFFVYANLDVIGDGAQAAEATWQNQRQLEDHGLAPLPVFHAGEPFDALDRLLSEGYGYIGLGGLVGRKAKQVMPWLVKCFQMAEGQAVFHGFGLTQWEIIRALPFYSIDSTSWGSSFIYGQLRLFDPTRGSFVRAHISDHGSIYDPEVTRLIRFYGFDPQDFSVKERYSRRLTCQLSARSWVHAERYVRQRHGEIMPPTDRRMPEGPLWDPVETHEGLRWYCANTAHANLRAAAAGLHLYLAENDTTNLTSVALAPDGDHEPLNITSPGRTE